MSIRRFLRSVTPDSIRVPVQLKRLEKRHEIKWSDPAAQVLLRLKYREMAQRGDALDNINDSGFQVFSAADEDGILLYLFSMLGVTNRTFVDIGSAGIEGSATANLIVNHGWHGLHMEASKHSLNLSRVFYRSRTRSRPMPPTQVRGFVDAENVNRLIEENGVSGEIDFLSIDIDSNDYWVWKALTVIRPRVVQMEFQPALGSLSKTIPYDPKFDRSKYSINKPPYDVVYCGVSLQALIHLATEKGYRFVGCDSLRVNGFFVLEDANNDLIPAADLNKCLDHPRVKHLVSKHGEGLKELPWETIEAPTQTA